LIRRKKRTAERVSPCRELGKGKRSGSRLLGIFNFNSRGRKCRGEFREASVKERR